MCWCMEGSSWLPLPAFLLPRFALLCCFLKLCREGWIKGRGVFGLEGVTVRGSVLEWDIWRCRSERKSSKSWLGACVPKSLQSWKCPMLSVGRAALGSGCSWEVTSIY